MTNIYTRIEFGKKYRDTVTGFEGVCTGIVRHQFGCVRACLQPKAKDDGTIPESVWFDEESLEDIKPVEVRTGGPMPAPKRAKDPA